MWHPQQTTPSFRSRTQERDAAAEAKARLVYTDAVHLHGPLAMAEAPNGDLIVANSDVINSNPAPTQRVCRVHQAGSVYCATLESTPHRAVHLGWQSTLKHEESFLAAVDDNTATLILWRMPMADVH